MPPSRDNDLYKHTLNLRRGDYEKMGELFPELKSAKAVRTLISKFVDKHYGTVALPEEPTE